MTIFLFLLFIADYTGGIILNKIFYRQKAGRFANTTYTLERSNEDIIILGDSRALHHLDPKVFTSQLNLSCYNAGSDGQGIFYYLAVQRAILERYSPKIIILNIDDDLLDKKVNRHDYDRLSFLLPYYKKHPEIRSIINKRRYCEKYIVNSNLYAYNSTLLKIFGSFVLSENSPDGYVPLHGVISAQQAGLYPPKKTGAETDLEKKEALNEFIKNAKAKEVNLVFTISPMFREYDLPADTLNILQAADCPIIDCSKDSDFTAKKSLFKDAGHLNKDGAKIFSRKTVSNLIDCL